MVTVYRPERWAPESSAEMLKNIPAIFLNHVFTFLGGSHACIGGRFSVAEYVFSHLPLAHSLLLVFLLHYFSLGPLRKRDLP